MDGPARLLPALSIAAQAEALRQPQPTVDGDPAHHLAVGVVELPAAALPDRCVGQLPAVDGQVDHGVQLLPELLADLAAEARVEVGAVQQLAVDVELELVDGTVADPHRLGAAVAAPVAEHLLGGVATAVDPVEVLHLRALTDPGGAQPGEEVMSLLVQAQLKEAEEGERGVPQPGEAVVPVAPAAERLRQRGGGGGDDGPGRRVDHQLERERRPPHRLGKGAGVVDMIDPPPPELLGLAQQAAGRFDRPGGLGGGTAAAGVLGAQREGHRVPRPEREGGVRPADLSGRDDAEVEALRVPVEAPPLGAEAIR